ncbi:MAG: alcohol dehydrogenase catalytic domain-containing protein [Thermodesulfovibrionales bacterium]|nr:alcohol dehydrogenase catalytic domain-containing protein [Thermodesulfovibrionales bacterium]
MKSAFLLAPQKIELRDIEIPRPQKGELLVKIKTALTCGTDLKAFMRGHPVIPMPGPFGHEFSGVVEETGGGTPYMPGDAVMAVHSAPCLKCPYCKKGLHNLCESIMDTKVIGAFSEYMLLPAHIVRHNVFYKPKKLGFEEAAFLEPLSCVVHGMAGLDIKKGDNALVIGAGPIGLLHLLLLKRKGAKVTVSDIKRAKLLKAKLMGAKEAVTPDRLEPGTPGFDYIFECTGLPQVWEASAGYLRKGGTLILFGGCPKGAKVTYDAGRLHYGEITLKGVFHFRPSDVREAYRLLTEGGLGVGRLVSGRYPLKEIRKAFEKLLKGEGIKYAIVP